MSPLKFGIGIVLFVLLMTVRPSQSAEDKQILTNKQVMQIREIMQRLQQEAVEERNTSAYWYKRFEELQLCVAVKASQNLPALSCIEGYTPT